MKRLRKASAASVQRSIPELRAALLAWYRVHGRAWLPWRTAGDPYRVLVSEFMLQQTQVERVAAAFERFVAAYPSFSALASASRADVVRAWKGLGYNMRAVRLHEVARAVMSEHGGELPRESEALRALPGIGAYTAGAIRVFAFDLDDVAVDVNVRRVVHRLCFGIEHPPVASANGLDATARELLPKSESHAWNSALMDLGAMVCTARSPSCERCPVRSWCVAAPAGPARIADAAKMRVRRDGPQARLPFEATRRFIRGRVLDRLRELEAGALLPAAEIESHYPVEEIVRGLERDGLIVREAGGIRLR